MRGRKTAMLFWYGNHSQISGLEPDLFNCERCSHRAIGCDFICVRPSALPWRQPSFCPLPLLLARRHFCQLALHLQNIAIY